jgi:peptidoglycan/LPS O-acetylase OafA/YrhL
MNSAAYVTATAGRRDFFLDQIRAVSILSVMMNHFRSDLAPGGGIGVGVFFALSGYLIGKKLLKTPRNAFAYTGFIIRRIFRVYPLLLLVLGLIAVCMHIAEPSWFDVLSKAAVPTALLYDGPETWTGYGVGVLWTLRVEIAFYLSLPVAMFILGRRLGLFIYCLTFLTLYWLPGVRSGIHGAIPIGAYLMLWGGALAVGSLFALLASSGRIQCPITINRKRLAYAIAGVSSAAYIGLLALPPTPVDAWHLEVIAASIIGCGFIAANMLAPMPVLPGLPFIGRVSFSMYLIHGIMLDYGSTFAGLVSHGQGEFLITIFISYLTFKLIERPGIALGEKLSSLVEPSARAVGAAA